MGSLVDAAACWQRDTLLDCAEVAEAEKALERGGQQTTDSGRPG